MRGQAVPMVTARSRRTLYAVVGSVLAHVAAFSLVWLHHLSAPPAYDGVFAEQVLPVFIVPKKERPPPATTSPPSSGRREAAIVAPGLAQIGEPRPATPSAAENRTARVDLSRALRGSLVGCANADIAGLSREERERCADRLARGAASAPKMPLGLNPGKLAYYDAVARAKAPDRPPVPLKAVGALGVYESDDRGQSGHGPGFGCKLAFGGGKSEIRRPPNSLAIGPCYLQAPNGMLTREVDIPPP